MEDLARIHWKLPVELRSQLANPVGELIEGTVEQTIPILKDRLFPHDFILVAVGDVTANLFVENGFQPNIIVTDGQTKRQALKEWKDWDGYEILHATCPAAEITPEAWKALQTAIELAIDGRCVHVKIQGEEDLLVLPLLVELPLGSAIVYGQPNTGAVIRPVTELSKSQAIDLIRKMDS